MRRSLAPILTELEKAHQLIEEKMLEDKFGMFTNDQGVQESAAPDLVKDQQGKAIISIQNQGKRTQVSWFKAHVWESQTQNIVNALAGTPTTSGNDKFDEIVLADSLLSQPLVNLLVELSHQTIHQLFNPYSGTVSPNGYHTNGFKKVARSWFFCNKGKNGWGDINPKDEFKKFLENEVIPKLNKATFDLWRDQSATQKQVGSNLKKWSCGCTNLRVSTFMKGTCGLCGKPFRYADKDKDEPSILTWLMGHGYVP